MRRVFPARRRGAVLTSSQEIAGSTFDSAFTYTVDGELETITYPSGRVITYTYDANHHPTGITATPPGGGSSVTVVADVDYLPAGPPERLELGPATGRVIETLGHDWQYRRTTQMVEGP